MTLRFSYAAASLAVLAAETGIAAFVRDGFIRPYLGDSLAVVLVYLALRSVTPLRVPGAVAAALAVACAIEVGQGLHLVRLLGLEDDVVARCLLGSEFDPWDFLAYLAGAALVTGGETVLDRRAAFARRRRI